jgi:hypothetical protein
MINDTEVCLICGKPGSHWDVAQRGFSCQFVDGKRVTLFDENGNEKAV